MRGHDLRGHDLWSEGLEEFGRHGVTAYRCRSNTVDLSSLSCWHGIRLWHRLGCSWERIWAYEVICKHSSGELLGLNHGERCLLSKGLCSSKRLCTRETLLSWECLSTGETLLTRECLSSWEWLLTWEWSRERLIVICLLPKLLLAQTAGSLQVQSRIDVIFNTFLFVTVSAIGRICCSKPRIATSIVVIGPPLVLIEVSTVSFDSLGTDEAHCAEAH